MCQAKCAKNTEKQGFFSVFENQERLRFIKNYEAQLGTVKHKKK